MELRHAISFHLFAVAGPELGKVPHASLLAGVAEFNAETTAGGSHDTPSLITGLMSQLKGQLDSQKPCSSMVPTGEGLPSLPKKCVEKILAGEFIDLADLPPAKGKVKAIPNAAEGQIVVVQAADLMEHRKLIPDFTTWVQCFNIYTAVVISKEPERAKNLLAYMSLIAKCSLKFEWPSWAVYDLNFRQDAADSGLKDWSKVEPSTYAQCFTGASISQENWCRRCHSIDHVTDTCPIKPGATARKRESRPFPSPMPTKKRPSYHSRPETCKKFNTYNRDCRFGDMCMYQHKCEGCGEPGYPVSRCVKSKKGQP